MKTTRSNFPFSRGQSLIEFALVFPLLILIILGTFDFGLLFMTYHTVQNAGREGVRYAVVLRDLLDDDPRVINKVESLIPDGEIFSNFNDNITSTGVSDSACEANNDQEVTVTITGTYNFVFLRIIGINSIDITIPTTMRYEQC